MNLRGYLKQLDDEKELVTLTSEIDARFEIACLTDHQSKRAGAALRFKQVKGTDLELCTNLFGSPRRMAMALGVSSLSEFGSSVSRGFESGLAYSFVAGQSSTQEVEPDLGILPQIRFWPKETRSFLTLAVVVTCDPDSLIPNFGLYRVGVAGRSSLTLNLLPGSGGGHHLAAWHRQGKPMPVAILLGATPQLIFAAAANLPQNCREDCFAAWLRGGDLLMDKGRVIPCQLPAEAELILEGVVSADHRLDEGPFGCFRGNYGGGNLCPLIDLQVMRVTHDPILPLTLAGPMPMEDCWMAQAQLEIDRARLKIDMPYIEELWQPLEAAFSGVYFIRTSTNLTVAQIFRDLKESGILRPLRALVLCQEIPRGNWREVLRTQDPVRIWCDDSREISYLYDGVDICLKHPTELTAQLRHRLNPFEREQLNL